MPSYEHEQDEAVVAESKPKLKRPPLYRVLLHNDNFTTMEFVVFVLQTVFQHTAALTAISAAGVPAPGGVPIK